MRGVSKQFQQLRESVRVLKMSRNVFSSKPVCAVAQVQGRGGRSLLHVLIIYAQLHTESHPLSPVTGAWTPLAWLTGVLATEQAKGWPAHRGCHQESNNSNIRKSMFCSFNGLCRRFFELLMQHEAPVPIPQDRRYPSSARNNRAAFRQSCDYAKQRYGYRRRVEHS